MSNSMYDSQRYPDMSDAYRAIYENRFAAHGGKDTDAGAKYAKPSKGNKKGVYTMKGKDGKPLFGEAKGYQEGGTVGDEDKNKGPVMFGRAIIPGQVVQKKTQVNIEVNPNMPKIGEVEKAYYAYPAGFDPTNREDITRKGTKNEEYVSEGDIQYPSGKKQSFTKSKDDPKVAAGRKAAKEMGLKHNEEVELTDDEFYTFMVEQGLCDDTNSAESMFDHMSQDWFLSLYEEAKKKKGRCWTGYKPTPGKEPYSPGSCEKA